MARNGLGTYQLPAGAAVVTGTTITKTWWDTSSADYAAALTASIANNGETPILADLPMSTYKHTGVGNATARDQYAAVGQVQDGSFIWCGTAGGTANALTMTPTPAITAYAAGQTFRFKAAATQNTGATTVAVSGLATIAIQNNGSACTGYEIQPSHFYQITLDTTSTAQLTELSSLGSSYSFVDGGGTQRIYFGGNAANQTIDTFFRTFAKLGNVCLFHYGLLLSNKGTSTGTATFGVLPFNVTNAGYCNVAYSNMTLSAGFTQIVARPSAGGTSISLYQQGGTGALTVLNDTHFANNSEIHVTGFYFV